MYGNNMLRGTQDWQIDAYEKRGRNNPYIRHQRLVIEIEHDNTDRRNINEKQNRNPNW
jgi:hypothetical protein